MTATNTGDTNNRDMYAPTAYDGNAYSEDTYDGGYSALEREEDYYKAKVTQRTWFRLTILLAYGFFGGILLEIGNRLHIDGLFQLITAICIIHLVFAIYFLTGLSRTLAGQIIQLIYGILLIVLNTLFPFFLYWHGDILKVS